MARSKFPGKPSKPVNKTRINVLITSENETISNLSNISIKQDYYNSRAGTTENANRSVKRHVRTRKSVCKSLITRNSITKRITFMSSSNSSNSQTLRRNRKRKDQSTENELSSKLRKTKQSRIESNNLMGKFVLPSRSVHSSRVIKPNKRFINVEAVNSVQLRTFKKRVVNKKNNSAKCDLTTIVHKSKCILNTENAEYKRDNSKTNQKSLDNSVVRSVCSNRRVILRQARLQLHTQTPTGSEGPFTANNSTNTSPPGTVTCGVCGAVRFYRFVKQARKFNIYSCESCRKFISKIIKRQVSNKKLQELQCLKGQGTCHVPPIVRSQHWKFRCAYKARCNACWLKMCLRSFQIPSTLKNNLLNLLPKFMRESDTFSNTLSLFSFHTNTTIDRSANTESSISLTPVNKSSVDIKKRPLRKQLVKKSIDKCDTINVVSEIKRQKLDLKGPRVKHVCRSASIVLGQPLAVFPENADKKPPKSQTFQIKTDGINLLDNDTSENKENNCSMENKNNENGILIAPEQTLVKMVNSKLDVVPVVNNIPKRDVLNKAATCLIESKSRRRCLETDNNIAIDFWENYDPEEVGKNGFGLIAALSFPMLAICYLCGSAGQDPLLYCCLCCEPYHLFCLEQPLQNINNNTHGYDWLCPKCTMCDTCGKPVKQKLKCQKCQKVYHPECFNNKLGTESVPMICSTCMRCKSCGSNSITKFIGNMPLCLICFQLRKKGNFCPLCQSCYDDNDCDTNMMECVKCSMWIHAKCEGLSEEQYQMLKQLPESIEFLCCICEPLPYWRKAIDSELRVNFNNVLKLLSKNRIIRNTLKWSPLSSNENNIKPVTFARKLQFTNENDVPNLSDDDNIENNQESTKNVQNKYKLRELKITVKPSHLSNDEILTPVDNLTLKTPNSPPLNVIKNKLNSKKCFSLKEFDENMVEICEYNKSSELLDIYRSILKQVFPWYNTTKTETNTKMSICKPSFSDGVKFEDITLNILGKYEYKLLNNIENDNRVCCLCKGIGDGLCYQEARLLYCGNNEWIHANCALWSSEVYEEIDGSLQNIQSAITRGRHMRCSVCKQRGASIGCCAKSCHETYHFLCAYNTKCYFMQDKSIFCPAHGSPNNEGIISSPSDFAIFRSIYVELDQKRKRFVEHKKVQFMVGSLQVINLGVIVPVLSDNSETIIPINFICKRLFWSTIEPWKLIPYVITTRVLSAQSNNTVVDKNFTIDHTASRILIERTLKEITLWQKETEKIIAGLNDYEEEEEPQNENGTDILSPELTDAILEELPHEFIDGISMQDIFPKLMNTEEILGIDFKVTDISSNESSKTDSCLQLNNEQDRKNSYFDDEKELFETVEDTKLVNETKDCKSDNLQQLQTMNKIVKTRNHQRASNVAFNYKFPTKQVKPISQDKTVFLKLLQVDGAYDSSDCENHEDENIIARKLPSEPVKCERCQCTYRTQVSYKRHLATCEEISTSESDSELTQDQEEIDLTNSVEYDPCIGTNNSELTSVEDKNNFSEPFLVTSYKSYSSYQETQNQIHEPSLNPHIFVNTDTTSKTINLPQNSEMVISNFQPILEQNNIQSLYTSSINQNIPISVNPASAVTINQPMNTSLCDSVHDSGEIQSLSMNEQTSLPINQMGSQQPLYISHTACNSVVNQPNSIPIVQTTPLSLNTTPLSINQAGTISLNAVSSPIHINQPVEVQPQQLTIQPVAQEISSVININPSNHIGMNTKMLATPNVVNSIITPNVGNSVVTQTLPISQTQYGKPILKSTLVAQKSLKSRGRPRLLAAKKTHPTRKTVYIPQSVGGGTSIVLQQLPANHMIPTFVETFQQQTGQNLQYITTVTPQITSAITTQPRIIQLQTEGTLVNLIPSVPPAVILPQPHLLNDQILVDNNGSLMWTPQTVQPVFLGFETIVQNTVLQSQQFLPSPLPGVLTTNSSYSSTTQVFQTSKLEPLLDVSSGNIVLLNSTPTTSSQSFQIPQAISNPPPNTPLMITENKPAVSWNYIESSTDSTLEQQSKVLPLTSSSNINCSTNNSFSNSNSINLPVAPFIPEPGIPTNIVTPTPKPVQSTNQLRPMNRVLPMPTNNSKQIHKITAKNIDKTAKVEIKEDDNTLVKPQEVNTLDEEIIKPINSPKMSNNSDVNEIPTKEEDTTSLKLVFQKQNEGGLYKISNNFNKKNLSSIQIAPLKPINTKSPLKQIELQPEEEEIENNKSTNLTTNYNKQDSKTEAKPPPEKQENSILYTVETQDGFHYSATSINDVWMKIFEAVQAARISYNMPPLPSNSLNGISGLHLLGLKSNGLKYLLEQLPDANKCTKYKPMFHARILETDIDEDHSSSHCFGTARCLPHEKLDEPSDMFGWLASKHRKPLICQINDVEQNTRRGSVTNLPMAMRFRHLKLTSRQSVGVYHSKIHKRGLFCHRDIELGEMVIEYAGEVIRSILADKRERQYTVKGMGCYMFRIDENFVVDATMKGNAARFINHSCDPNCYSKVIEILGHKHIIIFALRKIICGEELTYDYKFPFEEDKIPCTCNSRRCRKFLN